MANDDLMQIDIVGKRSERLQRDGAGLKLKSIAEMDFAEPDVIPLKLCDGRPGFFELDCEMAGIIVDTQVFV